MLPLRLVAALLLVAAGAAHAGAAQAVTLRAEPPADVPVCVSVEEPPQQPNVDVARPCGPPHASVTWEGDTITVTVCDGSGLLDDCIEYRIRCEDLPTRERVCFAILDPSGDDALA